MVRFLFFLIRRRNKPSDVDARKTYSVNNHNIIVIENRWNRVTRERSTPRGPLIGVTCKPSAFTAATTAIQLRIGITTTKTTVSRRTFTFRNRADPNTIRTRSDRKRTDEMPDYCAKIRNSPVDWKVCSPTVETEIPNESRRRRQRLRMDSAPNRIFWTRPISRWLIAAERTALERVVWPDLPTPPPTRDDPRGGGWHYLKKQGTKYYFVTWKVSRLNLPSTYNEYLNHSILWVEIDGVGGVVLILQPVHLKHLSFSTVLRCRAYRLQSYFGDYR